MADNITIPATGSGTATPVVATDDAGVAGHVQIVKLAIATDASATAIPATAAAGLSVNPTDSALRDNGKIDIVAIDQYTPGQQLMAVSLPVVIASNQSSLGVTGTFWQATQPISGSLTTVSTVTNLSQMGGVAISLNTGVRDTGTQRVTIATNDVVPITDNAGSLTVDQPTGTNLHVVTDSGTITTVSTVTAVTTCNLAAETTKVIGTVRALGNAGAIFDAATGAAVPANALYNGARAATANPTSATGGNIVGIMADKAGRPVVTIGHVRELVGIQTTQISNSTAETTVVSAEASVFRDISSLVITNSTATAVSVTIKDSTAGTTRAIYDLAANGGVAIDFNPPMPQAAVNNNWTATLSALSITVNVNVVFVKNL